MKKIVFSILAVALLFTLTACGKKADNKVKESKDSLIKITDKEKGYVTTFKSINDKFVQTNPKYNQVDSEELGVFISFQYIESSREALDYAKTHNFLGNEYAKGQVKDYKWNKYEGHTYGLAENEAYFRILLDDDGENVVVLSAFVGPKVGSDKKADLTTIIDNADFQKFLNSVEFKKEK